MEKSNDFSMNEEAEFNQLALELFRLQFSSLKFYSDFCRGRGIAPDTIQNWTEIPPFPASGFKEFDVTSLEKNQRTHLFLSSGTTESVRSRHFHSEASLKIYEKSVIRWFLPGVLPDLDDLEEKGPASLFLTPDKESAPHSSLVHMFSTIQRLLGWKDSLFCGKLDESSAWTVDISKLLFALRKSICSNRPLVIFGTAINFLDFLEHFEENNIRYHLAEGSRILETGGYKGQTRTLPKEVLYRRLEKHLGIPQRHILSEYGMGELSSQAYESNLDAPCSERILRFPPWSRVGIISPETGRAVPEGGAGLLSVFDLANVYSLMAIQTGDLAVKQGLGFQLLGRATQSEPKGCSLMTR